MSVGILLVNVPFTDSEEEEDDKDICGTVYCYYICRQCFALGAEDPDCGKCGREACVYLQQTETP